MKSKILSSVKNCVEAVHQLARPSSLLFIEKSSEMIAECFTNKNKLLIAGNGGSLCDASHFAEEFSGFFRKKRKALPAIVINEPGFLTCVGNDVGFEFIFSRAIEAYGKEGDIFIGLTTSGNSKNLVGAFKTAKDLGLNTIAFLGKGGGLLKGVADIELIIDGFSTSDRIQEAHMAAIHIIIECAEERLFGEEILKEVLVSHH